ncbi:hypothetical protein EDD18DRAFT_1346784 [Armillaria luteobubalina]|uniref:Alpha/beta hydrolase fold-3 domain-containing protein n=1 Tax=Armillaria luteobubalina TaxID=153913 RepID=A0AA39QHM3_9AGAR|nr:hypothetical protein EDD18DRAFT_1346784 [Armillaria luteobubalina]
MAALTGELLHLRSSQAPSTRIFYSLVPHDDEGQKQEEIQTALPDSNFPLGLIANSTSPSHQGAKKWKRCGRRQYTSLAINIVQTLPHELCSPLSHNLCFIATDYRLAPQTKFLTILSDCKAAIDFLFTSDGSSAGGWLSLLCETGIGFKASGPEKGRAKSIAALYPTTDLLDPFWMKQYPVCYYKRVIDKEELRAFLDHKGEKVASPALDSPRNVFYSYMIQEGILADLFVAANLKSGEFALAPTYIVHGDVDDKVSVQEARDVVVAAGPDTRIHYRW